MKTILLSMSAMLLSFAAQAGSIDPAVAGAWKSTTPIAASPGITVFLGMNFKDSTAVMSSICTYQDGQSQEASVEVPVSVGAGKITVLAAGQNQNKEGGRDCNVSVEAGAVDYSIVGAVLRLSGGGNTLDFNRR